MLYAILNTNLLAKLQNKCIGNVHDNHETYCISTVTGILVGTCLLEKNCDELSKPQDQF